MYCVEPRALARVTSGNVPSEPHSSFFIFGSFLHFQVDGDCSVFWDSKHFQVDGEFLGWNFLLWLAFFFQASQNNRRGVLLRGRRSGTSSFFMG